MLIDGEKWACEACVRGHRVSNCQHYDRQLQHINKKGRPVTQCQHCRSQRKTRAAHIKCDCGEKSNKCVHLGAIEGHSESCCCNHGAPCSCSGKKSLDAVPESAGFVSDEALEKTASSPGASGSSGASGPVPVSSGCSSAPKSPIRRRRANTTRSESTTSLYDHGRVKSASHKHARAVSQKTSPYHVNRIGSSRSTSALTFAIVKPTTFADGDFEDCHSSRNGSPDSVLDDAAYASVAAGASSVGAAMSSFFPTQMIPQPRRSRSETASPLSLSGSYQQPQHLGSQLPPLNTSIVSYDYSNYNAFSPSADRPLFSAGLDASVDWSHLNLGNVSGGGSFVRDASIETDNYSGVANSLGYSSNLASYDFNDSEQAPTMTTATSGDVSETEDVLGPGVEGYEFDYETGGNNTTGSSSVAYSRTSSGFNLPTTNMRHVNINLNLGVGTRPIGNTGNDFQDLHFFKANKFMPTAATSADEELAVLAAANSFPHSASLEDDEPGMWMSDYHAIPSLTDSPRSDNVSLWGPK